jgi:hypothetical protein
MQIMEVLAEPTYTIYAVVGETGTFGENEVSNARHGRNDSLDGVVGQRDERREVKVAEMVESAGSDGGNRPGEDDVGTLTRWKAVTGDVDAVCETEFAQVDGMSPQSVESHIGRLGARHEVYLE